MDVFKVSKVNVNLLFIIVVIAIVSLGNCLSPKNDSCDCELGSNDKVDPPYWRNRKMKFPWSVDVSTTDNTDRYHHFSCVGTLISNKHVLAPASCVIPKLLLSSDRDMANHSVPFMQVNIIVDFSIKVSTIYVHKNYNDWTHDFDICILELSEKNRFAQPVVLPQSPLISYSGKLPAAIGYRLMNVSVWSNDKCAKTTNLTPDNIMCIDAIDNSVTCESDLNEFFGPVFHVLDDGREEIIGIPNGCIYNNIPFNNLSFESINFTNAHKIGKIEFSNDKVKSAIVYTRVTQFLPWIKNILYNQCMCQHKTSHLGNIDALIVKVEKCRSETHFCSESKSILKHIAEFLQNYSPI